MSSLPLCQEAEHPEGIHDHEPRTFRGRAFRSAWFKLPAGHYRHGDHRDPDAISGPWFCCASVQLGLVGENDCARCGGPWPCPESEEEADGR